MPENFENQNEKEIKIEKKEILGERFLEILESPNFLKALTMAAEETIKSGRETAFNVYVLENEESYIPTVTIGGADSTVPSEEEIQVEGYNKIGIRKGLFLDFHFHPDIPLK